ncbi:uncharacterized protein LOC117550341 isoform X2 [Gymnodraco acuticeps]|uniref:Uncharacterized protein LOC117550341 isoform X2 n=1 Tax=Gymnodraco acuticeps TaxID=8218 RepID=A0A6P8UMQ5_GYMAC|nr:uncharacterized protein LOC117550341 isoform X2 [Gymnodraco acuticeps]
MKKMIIILLLLFLASCVSALKHFIYVNVTQTSYQAEENQNITLEWTFSTRRDTSLRSISTFCYLYTEDRTSVLFHLNEGVESPESQDPQFAGRLQWDKDVLTEGRLTLHVSRLRTSDSGFYQCDILVIPDGSNSNRCSLNVTEAKPNSTLKTELQTPDPNQETDVKGRHLIGPGQPIEASVGDDVILPCSVSPDYNVEDLTVEWSLPDLKPDPSDRLSRVDYVFVYRRRREEVDMKLQEFIGRTELFEDELKVGNISLKISNVTLADAGKYRCFIPKLEGGVKEAVVRLVVEPRANSTLTTETQTNSQTPDPNQETDVKVGQPPLWALVLSVCIVLVMVVVGFGVAHFLLKRCVHEKETKRCII